MNGVKDDELHTIERVIASPDEDAIGGTATYCIGCGSCAVIDPAFRIAKNADAIELVLSVSLVIGLRRSVFAHSRPR